MMVALGLLLFFERFYVLRVYLNRFLEWVGLDTCCLVRPVAGGARVTRPRPPARGRDVLQHDVDVDTPVLGAVPVSRRAAFSSWRSQPGRLPRVAWSQATATWTSPWRKSRSAGGASRHSSSSSS